MEALRKIVEFDEEGNLKLSMGMDFSKKKAELIFLLPAGTDIIANDAWFLAIKNNPVFDFLKDPAEDIYTLEDGKPYER